MRVLVTGAGGFLGRHVVANLLQRNHQVRAVIRPAGAAPEWPGEVEIFRADLRVHEDLVAAFDGVDVVVHAAAATSGNEDAQFASTVVATERFLDAMIRSSVKRLVHVSSLVVYDWTKTKRVMDERAPMSSDFYDMGPYTIAKIWQERLVSKYAKSHALQLTILRPGFVWGEQHAKIAGMGRRFGRTYLLFGPSTRLPLTHVKNCADCIGATVDSTSAIGEIFNVVDSDDIRVWRYVREYALGAGERGWSVPVPYTLGLSLAHLASLVSRVCFGKTGKLPSLLVPRRFQAQFKPLQFDNRKLKDVLRWNAPLSFDDCVRLTYTAA